MLRSLLVLAALASSCSDGGGEPLNLDHPRPDLGPPDGEDLPPGACDVVLISLDTTRADVLTFEDEQTAPNLVRLASRGTIFERAVAGSSWTLPSHVELVTGLAPSLHGVHDDQITIDPRHVTLAQHLDARGTRSCGIYTGWFLAAAYGFDRGFEHYSSAMAPSPLADRALAESLSEGGEDAWWASDVRTATSWSDVSSGRAVDLALEWLETVEANERIHLFLHLFDPHHDYIPPSPYDERFDPDYRGAIDGRSWWSNTRVWDPRETPSRRISDRDLEHVQALYRGEVAWCDEQIGRLLSALESMGRMENTLFVITSDHGEEFFEHGNRGHRQTLYEEVLRIPLLVVPPVGESETRVPRSGALASLADVLPTVLDYVGGPSPLHVWGRSLRPAIEGGTTPDRLVTASLGLLGVTREGRQSLAMLEAFHDGNEKLIRRVRLDPDGTASTVEAVEHYDIESDSGESRATDPLKARALWERAEALQEELRVFASKLPRSAAAERRTEARSVFSVELAELGYAEGELPGIERLRGVRWPSSPLRPLKWDPRLVQSGR